MSYVILERKDKMVAKSDDDKPPIMTEIKKNVIVEIAIFNKKEKIPERVWGKVTYRKGDQLKVAIDDTLFQPDLYGLKAGDKLDLTKKQVINIWRKNNG
jgi:hypothetical protein